jgi:hypothetical protein
MDKRKFLTEEINSRANTVCKDYSEQGARDSLILELYEALTYFELNTIRQFSIINDTIDQYINFLEQGRENEYYKKVQQLKDIYEQIADLFNNLDYSSLSKKEVSILNYEYGDIDIRIVNKPVKEHEDKCKYFKSTLNIMKKAKDAIHSFENLKNEMMTAVEERYDSERIYRLKRFFEIFDISRLPLGKDINITFNTDIDNNKVFNYEKL